MREGSKKGGEGRENVKEGRTGGDKKRKEGREGGRNERKMGMKYGRMDGRKTVEK